MTVQHRHCSRRQKPASPNRVHFGVFFLNLTMLKHTALLPTLRTLLKNTFSTIPKGPSVFREMSLKDKYKPRSGLTSQGELSPEVRAWRWLFPPQADSVKPYIKPYTGPVPVRGSGRIQAAQAKMSVSARLRLRSASKQRLHVLTLMSDVFSVAQPGKSRKKRDTEVRRAFERENNTRT